VKVKAAVVFEKAGPFVSEELELDEPREDEVLVRIVATGICHTDLAGRDGYLPIPAPPHVFGHEGSGVVERVGARVAKVKPGDHVVLSWDCCGVCPPCRSGMDAYCLNFFLHNFHGARPDGSTTLRRDGQPIHGNFFNQSSFASYALANERNTVKVSKEVPLEILGPLACGVQTGAGAVMNALRPHPGDCIAIFGAGNVGLSAVMAAVLCGCTTIIAVGRRAQSLEAAAQFGATHTINNSQVDPVPAIREITGGGADYSLECAGHPQLLRQAVDCLQRCGVCGLLGVVPPGTEVGLDMDLLMNGRTVKGIIEGQSIPDLFIPRLIQLYQQGRLPFDKMISFYPFAEINRAVQDMEQRRVIKPVLRQQQEDQA